MPGRLVRLTPRLAQGWAAHPRLTDYCVLVNVIHGSTIVASAIAETSFPEAEAGEAASGRGFNIDLSGLALTADDAARLRFRIGETDEWIEHPQARNPAPGEVLTVEDILAAAHRPRDWVTGATHVDAEAAGMEVETIIDMLYRDYLGRPSDAHGLAHYASGVRSGANNYDDVRRSFVAAEEFRARHKNVDNAPGSIFSQGVVMAAAASPTAGSDPEAEADPEASPEPGVGQPVPGAEIAALDGIDFVTELYRRILRKEPDASGMARYLQQLRDGVGKLAIIRAAAREAQAVPAGVRAVGREPRDPPKRGGEARVVAARRPG